MSFITVECQRNRNQPGIAEFRGERRPPMCSFSERATERVQKSKLKRP
jgi:hypothetical protein